MRYFHLPTPNLSIKTHSPIEIRFSTSIQSPQLVQFNILSIIADDYMILQVLTNRIGLRYFYVVLVATIDKTLFNVMLNSGITISANDWGILNGSLAGVVYSLITAMTGPAIYRYPRFRIDDSESQSMPFMGWPGFVVECRTHQL